MPMSKQQRWMLQGYIRQKLKNADQSDMFRRNIIFMAHAQKAQQKTENDIMMEANVIKQQLKILKGE